MKRLIYSIGIMVILLSLGCQETPQHKAENGEKAPNQDTHEHHTNHKADTASDDKNQKTTKASPHKTAMANIGEAHVHIAYNAPSVRGRIIWGGLVALGEVWVTGAHNATSISFSEDVKIAGKTIKKGKYAFFTIPSQEEWTLILNKNWQQHLADDYAEEEDVLRWKVRPQKQEKLTEQLSYQVIATSDKTGLVKMSWEKLLIEFEISQ